MTKPLRIGLVMLGGRGWMGGAEYIRNIIFALANLPQEQRQTFELSLLTSTSTDADFIQSVKPCLNNVFFLNKIVPPTYFNLVKWGIEKYLLRIPDHRYDIILKKYGLDFVYPVVTEECRFSLNQVVAWVPDFQHKYLPEFFSAKEINTRDETHAKMAGVSPLIIVSSRSAAADFARFYPDASFKVKVLSFKTVPKDEWYLGDPGKIQRKYALPDKFYIVSNQFWQHKGHLTLFKAMRRLKDAGITPVVVCTGELNDNRQAEYAGVVRDAISSLGVSAQLHLLGLIPKSDQIQLLRRSIALIQPSLFEGWSTIVEEARCLGKDVILSDLAVHLEQNPPMSRFFDRNSPDALASTMADCWESLSPGPDLAREKVAYQAARMEICKFAETFLEIAQAGAVKTIPCR
jgi:glycosyltransferase involved in cell wall biosynthesis